MTLEPFKYAVVNGAATFLPAANHEAGTIKGFMDSSVKLKEWGGFNFSQLRE
jgi:hypothetical protein